MSTQKSDNGAYSHEKIKLSEERESDLVTSELRMNLVTLQKFDQHISSIICTCKKVAQYQFSTQDHKWQKTNRNGSLFVYKRSMSPYFGFFILNQLSQENVNELITKKTEFECKKPFLMYRNESSIFALWFSNGTECEQISKITGFIKSNLNDVDAWQSNTYIEEFQEFKEQSGISDPAIKKASVIRNSPPNLPKSEPVTIPEQSPLSRLFKRQEDRSLVTKFETENRETDCIRAAAPLGSASDILDYQRLQICTVPTNLNQVDYKSSINDNELATLTSVKLLDVHCTPIESRNDRLPLGSIAHLVEENSNDSTSNNFTIAGRNRNENDTASKEISYQSLLVPAILQQSSLPSELPTNATTSSMGSVPHGLILGKEQLKATLVDLLQNDDDFLETINNAYLKHLSKYSKS